MAGDVLSRIESQRRKDLEYLRDVVCSNISRIKFHFKGIEDSLRMVSQSVAQYEAEWNDTDSGDRQEGTNERRDAGERVREQTSLVCVP